MRVRRVLINGDNALAREREKIRLAYTLPHFD